MSRDNALELSRRKALGALGTIGIAAAGAGAGTTAFLNDQESFEGNTVTAGKLNLTLQGGVVYSNRDDGPTVDIGGVTNDGSVTAVINFDDVKPGDCYVVHTDEIIDGNPAYLEMSLEEESDKENGYAEPEPESQANGDTDDPGVSDGGGELDDEMEVELWYGGGTPADSLVDPNETTITCGNLAEKTPRDDPLTGPQTLQDAFDGLAEDDDPTAGDADIDNPDFVPGGSEALELEPGRWRKFWHFYLPEGVGNEVQGDSVTFTIKARVVQARHNDPSNPTFS